MQKLNEDQLQKKRKNNDQVQHSIATEQLGFISAHIHNEKDKTVNQQKTRKIMIGGVEKWECCMCGKMFNQSTNAGRHARSSCFL